MNEIMSLVKSRKNIVHLLAVLLLFCSVPLFASTQLSNVQVNPLIDGQFELQFEFTEILGKYSDKLHYKPDQLIVDIDGANSILAINPIVIDKKSIKSVTTKRTEQGLRLLISLKKLMPYYIVKKKKSFVDPLWKYRY